MFKRAPAHELGKRSLSDVVVGNWYYGFKCGHCKTLVPVFDDRSGGTQKISVFGGALEAVCPFCKGAQVYLPQQLEQFQFAGPRNRTQTSDPKLRSEVTDSSEDGTTARKQPFKQGRRYCIFCEREPPKIKMSGEHQFGDWLEELFPRDDTTRHTLIVADHPNGSVNDRPTVTRFDRQGHSGSIKLSVVCTQCNNEWMSTKVEEPAKPILKPLILGVTCGLDGDMQSIVATWAAKTVMVSEQSRETRSVIFQSERTWLKEHLTPPMGWSIWIGSYGGTEWRDLTCFMHPATMDVPAIGDQRPAKHNFEFTILGLGKLAIVIINTSAPHLHGKFSIPRLRQIWPIVDDRVTWPTDYIATDADLWQLTSYPIDFMRKTQDPSP